MCSLALNGVLLDEPPVGLVPAEAELAATKAALRSFLFSFLRPLGGRKRKGHLGESSVAKESWPRRRKADGGQERMPRRHKADGGQERMPRRHKADSWGF